MLKEFQGHKLVGPFDFSTQKPARPGVYLFAPLLADKTAFGGLRFAFYTADGLGHPTFQGIRGESFTPDRAVGFGGPDRDRAENYSRRRVQWYGIEAP